MYPFKRWFPPGQGNIFVLHKNIAPLDQQLDRLPAQVKETFLTIRNRIFQLGKDVEERLAPGMICYFRGGEGMAWIDLGGKRIRIHLRKGEYLDKYGKIENGLAGYPVLSLREDELDIEHIEYVMDLIRQVYKANNKVFYESESRTKKLIAQLEKLTERLLMGNKK
jgi:predicted transport protein